MRHGGNDSDLTHAVFEAVAPRRLRARVRNFHQRPVLGHAAQNFIERDHYVGGPDPVFFQGHEFDEAQHYAFFPGKPAEGDDLIFVEAAHQDAVDLHWSQGGALGGANPRQHTGESVRYARDASKAIRIDGIHADGDAA